MNKTKLFSFILANRRPKIIIGAQGSTSFINPIPLTFTLSKPSADFTVNDVIVSGAGNISNFSGSGTSYTANLTITGANGTSIINVPSNSFHDNAGYENSTSNSVNITSKLILLDEFTNAENAPIVTPRTCYPGPGTLSIVDTNGVMSISGGKFVINGTTGADNGIITTSTIARTAGTSIFVSVPVHSTGGINVIGFSQNLLNNSGVDYGWRYNGTSQLAVMVGTSTMYTIPVGAGIHYLTMIMRGTGGFSIYKDGTGNYKLGWVYDASNTAEYAKIVAESDNIVFSFDDFKVVQLPAPWDSDYGIATNRTAIPSANTVTTSEADALTEMTWNAATGQVWNLYIRRTDDTHTWCIRADQTGGTIKLIEINGTETERASASQTWTNGTNYRVVVYQENETIKVTVANTPKLSYTSATYNKFITGVKTDRAGVNLITWPIVLSGAALSSLNP